MPFVVGEPCVDIMDRSCVEECPVDCIYEGGRKLYIHPFECIDCGACEPACPVEAISPADECGEHLADFVKSESEFFEDSLAGRSDPLGSPGGAAATGRIGVDTKHVAALPPRNDIG
jgi:NAD-dependent dihydropyrimidine dehydrogenase PreA subunit